ncbi:glycosyl hydrolase 115 family protein [Paenibacillus bouchesdurhonensis]|uniref:glycosyl hydrolase 115 family protein n=1 Tax=Paenibacillus bouchesdurhonensis TaxID=1870990 RepID=UPI000DA62F3C|nr:glycosyl hydrolase 115 family protein [Paenibacillus bouchesdurhonensis]
MFSKNYVVQQSSGDGDFRLVHEGESADIYVSAEDHAGVVRAANDLQADIGRVAGFCPKLTHDDKLLSGHTVIVGTIGKSPIVDALIAEGKLNASGVKGKWESFVIQTVADPLPGIKQGLVIAGSDKRGTIFGIYDVSEKIGVSPWYWWADVPAVRHDALYVTPGTYKQGEPSVKYRGIFLNDEGPSLMAWVRANYRDFTHEFYEKVFELLLRLKANYLWPAMWDNTFYEDDPLNAEIADRYGIVIGTSHHEPMMRPHGDWKKHKEGPWDYSINEEVLYRFWEEGIRRSRDYESMVTLGMRGDGDEAMGGHLSFEEKIILLEKIVSDQRKIIAEQTGANAAEVPQLWALYKEVQDYYEHGMRVPDDITLLWSDDNHGNLRRVPTPEERERSGGAGIYYHLDYVGGPRSYKWINTVPIPKIWEQMHKAYEYGADRIWIVNVGDLKPLEFPMEYFLRMAWDMSQFTKDNAGESTVEWAKRQFGAKYGEAVGEILTGYTKFNGRIKPELLNAVELYSLTDYKEAEQAIAELSTLANKADQLYKILPEPLRNAFFQLALYPVQASAQMLELHLQAARSRLYARQGRRMANIAAREAELIFEADRELTLAYNKMLSQGKWDHLMDQTHIGYTYWNQPPVNAMPETGTVAAQEFFEMGVAVEGSADAWPNANSVCKLPTFNSFTREARYIDVFNKGTEPFTFRALASVPWITLSLSAGEIVTQKRIWVDIDWDSAPIGNEIQGEIVISGPTGEEVTAQVTLFHPAEPTRETLVGHIETNGVISIEAEHYSVSRSAGDAKWQVIAGYGRTLSSVAVFPVTASSVEQPDAESSPSLEYPVYMTSTGEVGVTLYAAPSIDFVPGRGLRIGVSFDDEPVQIAELIAKMPDGGFHERDWEQSVIYNIRTAITQHRIEQAGYHTLRIWMIDPIVVLQKIVIDTGGQKPSLLGPPESYYNGLPAGTAAWSAQAVEQECFDPFIIPGVLGGCCTSPEEKLDIFVQQSGLYTLKLAAIVKPGDKPMLRLSIDGRELPGPICLRPAEHESGSLRYVADHIPLQAGRHSLQFTAESCRALNGEMQLELIASDQLRVRPSLQRGGLLPQKPLVVQVGLLGIDERYSCRYALNVSLYSEDDHLLDEATVTGTVPRGGEEVQRICLADSQQSGDLSAYDQEFRDNGQSFARNEAFHSSKAPNHNKASSSSREAPSGYKLKLAITYDGITRTYRSNWKL